MKDKHLIFLVKFAKNKKIFWKIGYEFNGGNLPFPEDWAWGYDIYYTFINILPGL